MTDVDGHRKAERELEDMGKRLADALEEKERLRQQKGGQSEEGGADASLKQKCDALAVEMEALRCVGFHTVPGSAGYRGLRAEALLIA